MNEMIILILILAFILYVTVQPFAYIRLYLLLKRGEPLAKINHFLRTISLIVFVPWVLLLLLTVLDGVVSITFLKDLFFGFSWHFGDFIFALMLYSWPLAASYFILYYFNKNNKLGLYLYGLLFIMFVFAIVGIIFSSLFIYMLESQLKSIM
ncbi:MAG: hypothetical protein Q4D05_05165 [Acinetobacter sp.]|nr:hypothetical protein [Acinetobacter sp.]